MLAHNQGIAQRYHEENAQQTADQSDQGNLQQIGLFHHAVACPQKQGRQRENGTGRQRFTGRTDGLNDVALQNGVFAHDHADHAHGNHSCRDRGRYRHPHAKTQIGIRGAEYNRQKNPHDDRCDRQLRGDFTGRNIRLKFLFLFHVFYSFSLYFLSGIPLVRIIDGSIFLPCFSVFVKKKRRSCLYLAENRTVQKSSAVFFPFLSQK